MGDRDIITIEPDKRGGKPCIRRMRITVYDVLGWLAVGMSHAEILEDFPELTEADIRACLEFAADRDHRLVASVGRCATGLLDHTSPIAYAQYSQPREAV